MLVALFLSIPFWVQAQIITANDGIDASQLSNPNNKTDPNGAVGTEQYMEWVDGYYQAYDKVTFAPVWSTPQAPSQLPWTNSDCQSISVDTIIIFDRLDSRWVIGGHTPGPFYYCVAISNTDDLTSSTLAWYTYSFYLNPILGANSVGRVYYPDYTKIATWADAYYITIDLEDPSNEYQEIGIMACALDRTNMLTGGTPRPMQCFSNPSPIPTVGALYLGHSLVPADIDGTTAPPVGREEFMVSIQNPPNDGVSTTSDSLNLWAFHVDWTTPSNSTFTESSLPVPTYTPGCYNPKNVSWTICVPELSDKTPGVGYYIDSVGDRLMQRLAYRNFGTYESFLVAHAVKVGTSNQQTGVRWYELRGSGVPSLYQSGTVNPNAAVYRFMPSIAQDKLGHAAVGYSVSNNSYLHPGIKAAWWSLATDSTPTEMWIQAGLGDYEVKSGEWGTFTSMTVDPVDECTFWYVNQYLPSTQTATSFTWSTRIAHFKVGSC
jgi:hypothetical protein